MPATILDGKATPDGGTAAGTARELRPQDAVLAAERTATPSPRP